MDVEGEIHKNNNAVRRNLYQYMLSICTYPLKLHVALIPDQNLINVHVSMLRKKEKVRRIIARV